MHCVLLSAAAHRAPERIASALTEFLLRARALMTSQAFGRISAACASRDATATIRPLQGL